MVADPYTVMSQTADARKKRSNFRYFLEIVLSFLFVIGVIAFAIVGSYYALVFFGMAPADLF